ncbi:TMEM175 family protein [Sphingomonas agri]|uniref:TMEM175 family protein n=1 Tax=Sphingomonas agri TaxID=1813878 RepID=UPI00311FD66C
MKRVQDTELHPSNRRIEGFSDGVFAVAVTIIVLEVRVPDSLAFANDAAGLQQFLTLFAIYALSFVVVGILWANHHYLILTLSDTDRATLWLNNHVLFWVTMVPVVARFFGLHPTSARATAAYAFVVMMCTVALTLLRSHASRATANRFHRALHRRVFRKVWIAIAAYAAAIPLAFVNVKLSWALLIILPAMFFLPIVRVKSKLARDRA